MSELPKNMPEQFPSDTDRLLFGADWNERFNMHTSDATAGMGAIRDIATNPDLSTAESLARQAQVLQVVCDSILYSAGAASMVMLARARTAELFDIEYEAR